MRLIFIGCLCAIFMASCSTEDTGSYEVGDDFIENNIEVRAIDTFSISTGTFKIDTLITSGTDRILLGYVQDEYVGKTSVESYIQLDSDSFYIDTDAVYDSIGMVLNYDTYYYGDTLKEQTYKIYEVLETIKSEEDDYVFYSSSELDYDETDILGELTFTPNLDSDSLYIPMDTDLGQEIFDKISDNEINTSDDFLQYFKGVKITSDTTVSSNVLGFNTSSSMRVYYTVKVDDIEDSVEYVEFYLTDEDKQFNHIETDLSTSVIGEVEDDETVVYSNDVESDLYMSQAGSGIVSKIEIPSIKKLGELYEDAATLSAELTFTPLKGSYGDDNPLPEYLSIYIVDHKNRLLDQLSDSFGNSVFAYLNQDDDEFNENTYYSVDLTAYVETIIDSDQDLNYSLAVQFINARNNVDRIVFSDEEQEDTKLTVKYLKY